MRAEVSVETFARLREQIRPTAGEQRWLAIPWRTGLWDGALEAAERGLPIFLWGMNGHPLGCT